MVYRVNNDYEKDEEDMVEKEIVDIEPDKETDTNRNDSELEATDNVANSDTVEGYLNKMDNSDVVINRIEQESQSQGVP